MTNSTWSIATQGNIDNADIFNRSGYRGEFTPIVNPSALEEEWRRLEANADCSFFLSWSWIGIWLTLIHDKPDIQLYRCYCDDTLIAMAIVVGDVVQRRLFFRSHILALNEACDPVLNMFIEYNGVLATPGHEIKALEQLLRDIRNSDADWDEIQLSNIPKEYFKSLDLHRMKLQASDETEHTIWITPLSNETSINSLIGGMSKNRRWQLRRTFKEYAKEGALKIDAAQNVAEALCFFHEMGVFHTQRWKRKGQNGSFTQPSWVAFHRALISVAFDRGEIQMLRIQCNTRIIGYLYNVLWHDGVHMLQSGFVAEKNNTLRPGYVSHMLAMQFNGQLGARQYDFMVGDSEYKRVLAEPHPPLISVRLQRPRVKFFIENALVLFYRKLRQVHPAIVDRVKKMIASKAQGAVVALSFSSIFEYDLVGLI